MDGRRNHCYAYEMRGGGYMLLSVRVLLLREKKMMS